ncbi:metallophosphoesterase family protein [Roseomonas alkaliterrae]|uniref:Diadenosine tetraphosphatase ApaH/serine/threonine PP2A family protein phosphatase n=1 Tax=Neoroseomonas alkaliterrae TaxID=1452450 RepID=A0A840Y687_9PROT|nr:diadenosine tetraphosphatase ApaH/serine/threonine PP2A family protein phosphatase [Neoroseomonas alkaliterrae]MBR0677617.1 metallophosphoesterase family protein [Neoroseomonas alkaliterrae]
MLIALLADIHGNLEAFQACLEHARAQGAVRYILLGDLVGYGADPVAVLRIVRGLAAEGALAVLGNHDEAAALGGPTGMTDAAAAAIAWTRARLDAEDRAFLAALPLTAREEGRLYVHAEASAPGRWRYVSDAEAARRCLEASEAHVTFCGHVHRPALYSLSPSGTLVAFTPVAGAPVPLAQGRSWLCVLGAVGQPRDGNPAASYLLLDTQPLTATWQRVPYDIATAARKIREAGLPPRLADRLFLGR